jgi:lipopolysaccharide export system permease protein
VPILYRYLCREIAKVFAIVLTAVLAIYLAVDFFEKVDDFIEAGVVAAPIVTYFLFKIPYVLAQIVPVGALLSVIMVFGLMRRNNELTALKSGGVGLSFLLIPVLGIGMLLTLILFGLNEVVIPETVARSNRIWVEQVKKKSVAMSQQRDIWLKGSRVITNIKYYDPPRRAVYGVVVYYFDDAFRLIRRLDAKGASYGHDRWTFYDVLEQRLDAASGQYLSSFSQSQVEPFEFLPDDLVRVIKKSEEMTFWELLTYIRTIEGEGYDATVYWVDLHAKVAFPWVCLVLCAVATGIGPRGSVRREGIAFSVGCGIATTFLYWFLHSFCLSLGYGDVLPALLAAWLTNLVFSCVALLLLIHAE